MHCYELPNLTPLHQGHVRPTPHVIGGNAKTMHHSKSKTSNSGCRGDIQPNYFTTRDRTGCRLRLRLTGAGAKSDYAPSEARTCVVRCSHTRARTLAL